MDGPNQSGTRLEGGRSRITIRYSPIWAGSNGATTRIAALPAAARIAAIRETGLAPARRADEAAHDVAAMGVFMSSPLSAALAPLMTRRTPLRNPHLRIRNGRVALKGDHPDAHEECTGRRMHDEGFAIGCVWLRERSFFGSFSAFAPTSRTRNGTRHDFGSP